MLEQVPYLELYLTCASFLLLIGYHAYLIHRVRHRPLTTSIGITNHLRSHWVESIMKDGRDILAVQTLRNWVMASSFLASTAILICLGLISLATSPEKMAEITPSLNALVREHRVLWLFKLMMIIVDFFVTFFNYFEGGRRTEGAHSEIAEPKAALHRL